MKLWNTNICLSSPKSIMIIIALLLIFSFDGHTQSIDKVEIVIGDEIILTSEIESQYLQYLSQGGANPADIKCELIEEIVLFENSPDNHEIVSRRVLLWEYLEEIKKDKYLSKFLILD